MDGAILINDKLYYIKFNINIFCEMKAAGYDIQKDFNDELDFTGIRALFYFGLKKIHGDQIKSYEDGGDLLSDYIENGGDLGKLSEVIANAFAKSMGIKAVAEGKQKVMAESRQETLKNIQSFCSKLTQGR